MAFTLIHIPKRPSSVPSIIQRVQQKIQQLGAIDLDEIECIELMVDHAIRVRTDPAFRAKADATWRGITPTAAP